MASLWERLFKRSQPQRVVEETRLPPPSRTPARPAPRGKGYPGTFAATAILGPHASQAEVFEPALKQFARAFRNGEPVFDDPEFAAQWLHLRAQVMEHLLRVVSRSAWGEHLVLRGSVLLKAYLGSEAREPGDMDWVVTPPTLKLNDAAGRELMEGLVEVVTQQPDAGGAVIDVARIAWDDIWTYDRAPGRRIVFPWTGDGLHGSVQMDLVFEEQWWDEPEWTLLPTQDGGSIRVRAATPALSLAWKLMWLESDAYPQGKDLYDAVLLAERTFLPFERLDQVLRSEDYPPAHAIEPDFPLRWEVDWDNFVQEYPLTTGTAADWQCRLVTALAPTFAARGAAE